MIRRSSVLFALMLKLTAALDAQSSCVRRLSGGLQPYTSFGFAIALIGDVNSDGADDFVVGDPQPGLNSSGIDYPGEVRVFSGATLGLLYVISGSQDRSRFGAAVAGLSSRDGDGRSQRGWGDVDGDGAPDFVVGAPSFNANVAGRTRNNAGLVRVVSGRTGNTIAELTGTTANEQFGFSVASGGAYRSGQPHFVVGAPGWSGERGRVDVFSGTGALVASRTGAARNDDFGYAVALVGDATGDGRADLLAASPGFAARLGKVEVFGDQTQAPSIRIYGAVSGGAFGTTVGAAGDLDGDGRFDFLVGNRRDTVFSYRHDGSTLYTVGLHFRNPSRTGHSLAGLTGIGDLDGDGRGDFAFGAQQASVYNTETGSVTLVSGATGRLMRELMDPQTRSFGSAVVALSAGSETRLLVGSAKTRAGSGGAATGQVHEVRLARGSSKPIGVGCSATNSEPVVRLGGLPPCIGEPEFGLTFADKPKCAQCPAVVHLGIAQTNLAIPGAGNCRLYVLPLVVLSFGGGARPDVFRRIPVPADPALRGGKIYAQGVAIDPSAPWPLQVVTSSALEFVIR